MPPFYKKILPVNNNNNNNNSSIGHNTNYISSNTRSRILSLEDDSRSVYTTATGNTNRTGASSYGSVRGSGGVFLNTIYTQDGQLQPDSDLLIVHDSLVIPDLDNAEDADQYNQDLMALAQNRMRSKPLYQQRAHDDQLRDIEVKFNEQSLNREVLDMQQQWAKEAQRGNRDYEPLFIPAITPSLSQNTYGNPSFNTEHGKAALTPAMPPTPADRKYFSFYDDFMMHEQKRRERQEAIERSKTKWVIQQEPGSNADYVSFDNVDPKSRNLHTQQQQQQQQQYYPYYSQQQKRNMSQSRLANSNPAPSLPPSAIPTPVSAPVVPVVTGLPGVPPIPAAMGVTGRHGSPSSLPSSSPLAMPMALTEEGIPNASSLSLDSSYSSQSSYSSSSGSSSTFSRTNNVHHNQSMVFSTGGRSPDRMDHTILHNGSEGNVYNSDEPPQSPKSVISFESNKVSTVVFPVSLGDEHDDDKDPRGSNSNNNSRNTNNRSVSVLSVTKHTNGSSASLSLGGGLNNNNSTGNGVHRRYVSFASASFYPENMYDDSQLEDESMDGENGSNSIIGGAGGSGGGRAKQISTQSQTQKQMQKQKQKPKQVQSQQLQFPPPPESSLPSGSVLAGRDAVVNHLEKKASLMVLNKHKNTPLPTPTLAPAQIQIQTSKPPTYLPTSHHHSTPTSTSPSSQLPNPQLPSQSSSLNLSPLVPPVLPFASSASSRHRNPSSASSSTSSLVSLHSATSLDPKSHNQIASLPTASSSSSVSSLPPTTLPRTLTSKSTSSSSSSSSSSSNYSTSTVTPSLYKLDNSSQAKTSSSVSLSNNKQRDFSVSSDTPSSPAAALLSFAPPQEFTDYNFNSNKSPYQNISSSVSDPHINIIDASNTSTFNNSPINNIDSNMSRSATATEDISPFSMKAIYDRYNKHNKNHAVTSNNSKPRTVSGPAVVTTSAIPPAGSGSTPPASNGSNSPVIPVVAGASLTSSPVPGAAGAAGATRKKSFNKRFSNSQRYSPPPIVDLPPLPPQFMSNNPNHSAYDIPTIPFQHNQEDELYSSFYDKVQQHHETKAGIQPVGAVAPLPPQQLQYQPVQQQQKSVKTPVIAAPVVSSAPRKQQQQQQSQQKLQPKPLQQKPVVAPVAIAPKPKKAPTVRSIPKSTYSRRGENIIDIPLNSPKSRQFMSDSDSFYVKSRSAAIPMTAAAAAAATPAIAAPRKSVSNSTAAPTMAPVYMAPMTSMAPMAPMAPATSMAPVMIPPSEAPADTGTQLYGQWLNTKQKINDWASGTLNGVSSLLSPAQVISAQEAAMLSSRQYSKFNGQPVNQYPIQKSHNNIPSSASSMISTSTYSHKIVPGAAIIPGTPMSMPAHPITHPVGVGAVPAGILHDQSPRSDSGNSNASSTSTNFTGNSIRIPIADVSLREIEPSLYTAKGHVDMEMVDRSVVGTPSPEFASIARHPQANAALGGGLLGAAGAAAVASGSSSSKHNDKWKKIFGISNGSKKTATPAPSGKLSKYQQQKSLSGVTGVSNGRSSGGGFPTSTAGSFVQMPKTPGPGAGTPIGGSSASLIGVAGAGAAVGSGADGPTPMQQFIKKYGPFLGTVVEGIRMLARISMVLRPIDAIADNVPMLLPAVVVLEGFVLLWTIHQVSIVIEYLMKAARIATAPAVAIGKIVGKGVSIGGGAAAEVAHVAENVIVNNGPSSESGYYYPPNGYYKNRGY